EFGPQNSTASPLRKACAKTSLTAIVAGKSTATMSPTPVSPDSTSESAHRYRWSWGASGVGADGRLVTAEGMAASIRAPISRPVSETSSVLTDLPKNRLRLRCATKPLAARSLMTAHLCNDFATFSIFKCQSHKRLVNRLEFLWFNGAMIGRRTNIKF